MKKIFIIIIATLLPLMASAGLSDQLFYIYDSSTKTATLTRNQDWACYTGHIIIPSKVTYNNVEYIVTAIGAYALEGSREWDASPSSVTIPSSVKSIEKYAFFASQLDDIYYLGDISAWCNISFGSSPGSYKLYVNNRLVDNLVIPSSVTSIGERTFSGCKSLTSITIPNSVTSIGDFAFEGCTGLTSVTIPNSVTSIGSSAFSGCSGLTSVNIPNSVTSIGSNAFSGCSSLNAVRISDLAAWCNIDFFCDEGKYDYLSNPLVYANHLYLNDSEVKSLVIPDGVKEIKAGAFFSGNDITSVTIPNSVTSIGHNSFAYCNLSSLTIPNSVTYVGYGSFKFNQNLTSVAIPNSVTFIGGWAFGGCNALTSVTIPNSVTEILESTFDGCSGLTSVTIPNSVTSIGESAFRGCSGLTSVTIPNSVTSIGSSAFSSCSGLTSVTIPSSVTSIGGGAFSGTPWFNNQPNGLIYAGRVAYNYKGNMPDNASVLIEDGTVGIADNAFSYCSGLTSVTIPNSVTSIGSSAFYNCSGLTSVTIPNSVKSIGDNAFYGCRGLTSVTIPNSVTSIGDDVFSGCSGLTSILSLNNIPPTCNGKNIFNNVNKENCVLWVPKGSVSAYKEANGWKDFTHIKEIPSGDLNFDKKVDKSDLDVLVAYIMGHPPVGFDKNLADINKDGHVDVADIVAFNNLRVGIDFPAYLNISSPSLSFEPSASSKQLTIACNDNWTASSSDDTWCTVSHASGVGDGQLTISVAENTSRTFRRSAVVTLQAGDEIKYVNVTQKRAYVETEEPATCVKVVTKDREVADWDSQFWILIDKNEPMHTGDTWSVSMKVRADKECYINSHTHRDPGDIIHMAAIGTVHFTTEWTEYTASGTIETEADGGYSIGFRLNEFSEANTFYFDDISYKLNGKERVLNNNCNDPNGTESYRSQEDRGPVVPSRIVDKVIVKTEEEPANCIKVVSKDLVEAYYDTQFWILIDKNEPMRAGDKWTVSMKVRADKECSAATEFHKDPTSYVHHPAIGTVPFTTEWTEYTASGTIEAGADGAYSIAFNLNDLPEANTYYFDDISFKLNGKERVFNNNCNDPNGTASYRSREALGPVVPSRIVDKVIVKAWSEPATCVKVISKDLEEAAWDTQFWILIDKNVPMHTGDTWSVSMKVRADKECSIDTHIHKDPCSWIYWPAIGTVRFTTEWTEYTASGTIEAGADGGYSIAFDLNGLSEANTYYFDDISYKLNGVERVFNNNCDDPNGTASYRSKEARGFVVPSRIVDKVIVKN